MDERLRFVARLLDGEAMSEVCRTCRARVDSVMRELRFTLKPPCAMRETVEPFIPSGVACSLP
jgi:hypothetical protein